MVYFWGVRMVCLDLDWGVPAVVWYLRFLVGVFGSSLSLICCVARLEEVLVYSWETHVFLVFVDGIFFKLVDGIVYFPFPCTFRLSLDEINQVVDALLSFENILPDEFVGIGTCASITSSSAHKYLPIVLRRSRHFAGWILLVVFLRGCHSGFAINRGQRVDVP